MPQTDDVDVWTFMYAGASPLHSHACAFAQWILSQSKSFSVAAAEVIAVQISLADVKGKSDLVVILEKEDRSRIALLIEDKIDSVFQNDQLGRYRLRG